MCLCCDNDWQFSLLLRTVCWSVSGQLLNTAHCVAIVCELFSIKLNELAVMHFDLQFNNLI